MSHWGNVSADLVEQVIDLHRHIGQHSYTAISIDSRDKLEIALHIANWRKRSRAAVFVEGVRMLFRAIWMDG